MALKTIEKIKQAEEKSEMAVNEAKEKAKKMVSQEHENGENLLALSDDLAQKEVSWIMQDAYLESEKEKEKILNEYDEQIHKIINHSKSKKEQAIEAVLSIIKA